MLPGLHDLLPTALITSLSPHVLPWPYSALLPVPAQVLEQLAGQEKPPFKVEQDSDGRLYIDDLDDAQIMRSAFLLSSMASRSVSCSWPTSLAGISLIQGACCGDAAQLTICSGRMLTLVNKLRQGSLPEQGRLCKLLCHAAHLLFCQLDAVLAWVLQGHLAAA